MDQWITPEGVSALGTLLAGLAALVAVLATWWQAARELRKRREEREAERDEKRRQKRAEVAADLAVAAQRFLIAIDSSASVARIPGASEPGKLLHSERSRVASIVHARHENSAPSANAFIDAWNVAKIFLPDEVDELCAELWQFRADTFGSQIYMLGMVASAPGLLEPFWHAAMGEKVHARTEELREKVLRVLRPHAQLHPAAVEHARPPKPAPSPARPFPFKPGEPLAIEPNALIAMLPKIQARVEPEPVAAEEPDGAKAQASERDAS